MRKKQLISLLGPHCYVPYNTGKKSVQVKRCGGRQLKQSPPYAGGKAKAQQVREALVKYI